MKPAVVITLCNPVTLTDFSRQWVVLKRAEGSFYITECLRLAHLTTHTVKRSETPGVEGVIEDALLGKEGNSTERDV